MALDGMAMNLVHGLPYGMRVCANWQWCRLAHFSCLPPAALDTMRSTRSCIGPTCCGRSLTSTTLPKLCMLMRGGSGDMASTKYVCKHG